MHKKSKPYTKQQIEEIVREEIAGMVSEASWADFLSRDERAKRRDAKARKAKMQKRGEQEQRVRNLFSEIARSMAAVPQDLEGKVRMLRDLKEKLSTALIWGNDPLMDLIAEDNGDE
tara:strand:+ start:1165 stop:1515 length:351 start_codon:yes stop_codon:yes gene_type:complete